MRGNDSLEKYLKRTEGISSRRVFMTVLMVCAVFVIGAVLVAGVCLKEQALTTDFTRKNIAPVYNILLEPTGWAVICLCVPLQVYL